MPKTFYYLTELLNKANYNIIWKDDKQQQTVLYISNISTELIFSCVSRLDDTLQKLNSMIWITQRFLLNDNYLNIRKYLKISPKKSGPDQD